MDLKHYQLETMGVLQRFFEEARLVGPAKAFRSIVDEPGQKQRLGRHAGPYSPLEELPEVPYVCLRLPTGGGKTVLAAHSVAVARDAWIGREYPVVLWLVPSNTIRLQTVEALRRQGHPYRQVLDAAFRGRVRVFDIADFTHVRPHDLRDYCCIIVGTIQTLRVTSTEGRKVYAHHEEMEPHFVRMRRMPEGLEKLENGQVKYSFANLLHVHRPLMIVDEAHNAVTGLSRTMQARVNPSAVIELTATPRDKNGRILSNILHSVTAEELKGEDMVKLPIVLEEHQGWESAVTAAVAKRQQLAEIGAGDKDRIRPITLFQAQPKDQPVTVEVLKTHLIEVERVSEERIAIATGDQRGLDGVDLFDPACKIEHVITIQALKEGWDCSLAYVFCSVSRIQSAVDVEQLLGRVLRMPFAERRKAIELNKAYAFLSEPDFGAAARGLADKLVDMGFEEDEAEDNIEPAQGRFGEFIGMPELFRPKVVLRQEVSATPELLAALEPLKARGLALGEEKAGRIEIRLADEIDEETAASIETSLAEADRPGFREAMARHKEELENKRSPAERGEPFRAPSLVAWVQGELELAGERLVEHNEWSLLDHPTKLEPSEFSIRETAQTFEIDIEGNRIQFKRAGEEDLLGLDVEVEGWTPEALVSWLEGRVRASDLHPLELSRWLLDLVNDLEGRQGIHMTALMRAKYLLVPQIRRKLDRIRDQERAKVFQRYLFDDDAQVETSFDQGFTFFADMYWDQRRYRGRWRPAKHYLGPDRVPRFDGTEDGEEVQCAQALDSLPRVRYWIRNVAGHPASLWLPTAKGRFYPDFVALLEDGRLFVVEYKGAMLAEGTDTREKRMVGALWERASQGWGLFLMVEKEVDGLSPRDQLLRKLD